ncbi:MAG: hypothetical protein JXA44_00535 [Methanospirillaceae archaeon]|nr:hypothetical protein [Methanospirillaceae archaeon]
MTTIDDYLQPLNNGVWEVVIHKDDISEPLSDNWEKSPVNVPTPGTVASYRNGQYHAHETKTEWRVHLDRYDPNVHPVLHLIDDAPLFLMISETIITLFSEAVGRSTQTKEKLKDQEISLKKGFLFGFILLLIGSVFLISPKVMYYGIIGVVLPAIVIGAGALSVIRSIIRHPGEVSDQKDLFYGGLLIIVGIILVYIPVIFWSLLLLVMLSFWMLSSAFILLNRARKGRSAIPEGFYSRLAIALISIIVVLIPLLIPGMMLHLFMLIMGVIIILLGCALISASYNLKQRSKMHPDVITL